MLHCFCSKRGPARTNGLRFLTFATQLPRLSSACVYSMSLMPLNNINISLSGGKTTEMYQKKKRKGKPLHAGGLKYWCDCEVNGSKSVQEGENGSYEEREQGKEGKTSLVKLGSEGLGRIINEVKCVCCTCGVESASEKPVLFLQGRQVCCYAPWEGLLQLGKDREHPLRGRIAPQEWTGKESAVEWGQPPLLGDTSDWLLMIWSIIHSKECVDTSRKKLCIYSFLFKKRCECSETQAVCLKKSAL